MRAELERLVESLRRDEAAAQACWERGSDPYDMGMADGIGGAINDLARILTRSDWIPVIERLPERSGYYLATMSNGQVIRAYFFIDSKGWITPTDVIAWQELPAPYRGEGGE